MGDSMTETTERPPTPSPAERWGRPARHRQPPGRQAPAWLRGLGIAVVVILAAAGVYSIGDGLTTADPAQVSAKVDVPAGGVMPGERFKVSGTASTDFERPVFLERQDRGSWSRLATVHTDDDGRFTFPRARADEGSRFRIALPAIRDLGQTHPAVTREVPGLRVVPQKVADFSVLPGIVQAGDLAADAGEASLFAEAAFTPVRPGRAVVVQRRLPGGTWERVARDTQGAEGKVRFSVPQDAGTPYQFRVLATPYDGAPAMASEAQGSNRWRLDLDDQFTFGVDTTRWVTRGDTHEPESKRTCAKADPSMVSSSGGTLDLSVAPDPAFAPDTCSWKNPDTGASGTADYFLNAHVGTQGAYSFRYGVAAARVKFHQPQGMHSAFWLQDSGEADGTVGAEIDIVEFFGRGYSNGGIAQFIYPQGAEEVGGTQPDAEKALKARGDNWWDRYHVFSVEWTPEEYVFRIDGEETLRTDVGVADRKVFVILSLLTSDWELKKLPEVGTGTASVDWVRVWQDTRLAGQNL